MTLWVFVPEDQLRPMIHLTPSGPRQTPETFPAPVLLIKRFVEKRDKKNPQSYIYSICHMKINDKLLAGRTQYIRAMMGNL